MTQDLTVIKWLNTVDAICKADKPQSERLLDFQKYQVDTCEWLNVYHPKVQQAVDNCISMYIVNKPAHHNTMAEFNGVLQIVGRTAELD